MLHPLPSRFGYVVCYRQYLSNGRAELVILENGSIGDGCCFTVCSMANG
jgi:hypothetical protein